jgi:hypothetical protein
LHDQYAVFQLSNKPIQKDIKKLEEVRICTVGAVLMDTKKKLANITVFLMRRPRS